ncbi:EAL domain-containing protein [Pseudomonas sp. N040]|nr:bifunctional diguanylate cyclase/phosphodiesterase [Pseudomonas sp. N040]MBF7728466.1 EAL domain-containing protein [Pseudomonas sp. N040]MBW7012106.1 EAL domain-containing protein [Pseudomonas sp. N040]
MKMERKHSLSMKLLRVVLLSALAIGIVLSLGQIIFDVAKTRQLVASDAQRILGMFRDPSTQAVYSLDREMGMQVIEGLFQHDSVSYARIGNPDEPPLAEKNRPLQDSATRWITDGLLGQKQTFGIELSGRGPYSEHFGDLTITLDTAPYGRDFLSNALVIFTSGILRSLAMGLLLYLVYYLLLTKPLSKIVEHLSNINPDRPGEHKLPMIKGHDKNELGLWINTANQLLSSIERNAALRNEAENSLQRMAQYDFLTGLPNRKQLQDQLGQILVDAGRMHHRVAVLCVGLDDFKSINEQFGYQIGDYLLQALADRLRCHSGRLGALARLGGDQFALVQPNIEQTYEAAELAQLILDDLEKAFPLEHREVRLRATIGITLFPEDGDTSEKLLQKAEQTMTLAKSRSRNRYQFFIASLDAEMRRRRELEKHLREALPRNELHLVYQPQIDYRTQRVVGVEALIRWEHPEHGFISPDLFIPLAEQNGSIIVIGEWVLSQACKQLREWHDQGFSGLRMAVNLSTVQLRHPELPRIVNNLMQMYRLPAKSLEVEITETGLMEDVSTSSQNLLSLRHSGALIAIDDFGTGYSSLSYLKSLPLDKIKIDKSFVQQITEHDDDATIVRAIIQLAKNLKMQVIAEGVENAEQEAYIINEGCDEGQGYFYSKPLPAHEMALFLKRSRMLAEHPSSA